MAITIDSIKHLANFATPGIRHYVADHAPSTRQLYATASRTAEGHLTTTFIVVERLSCRADPDVPLATRSNPDANGERHRRPRNGLHRQPTGYKANRKMPRNRSCKRFSTFRHPFPLREGDGGRLGTCTITSHVNPHFVLFRVHCNTRRFSIDPPRRPLLY
jgi:hypothetical protein